jgi:AcrR family transcriptional regulator
MVRKTKEEVVEQFRCASIQDAAMAVIARRGVDDATMQEIAEEAGLAKGTLYVYFRDRDELLKKTANRAFEIMLEQLEAAFVDGNTFEARLTSTALRQLRFFDENRELFRAYIALAQHDTIVSPRKPRTDAYARYAQRLERLFAEARANGEIRDVDPHSIAAVYRDLIRGVIVRRIEEKSKTPRETEAAFIVSVLLHGIQA